MRLFLAILGTLDIFVFGAMLFFYITLLRKGERHSAELVEISDGNLLGKTTYRHTVRVRFIRQGNECETETLTAFASFFFPKRKAVKLRKRYQGKTVHIVYNAQKPSRTLILEWIWRDFLLCAAWLEVGLFIVLAAVFEWF